MTLNDRRLLASALSALGMSIAAFGAAAAWLAVRHMADLAALCGPRAPHCGWCLASTTAFAAAFPAFAAAVHLLRNPEPAPLRLPI